jgi:type IV secretion system protein VirB11
MRNGENTLRHLLAPIQPLLDNPAITEIVINRPGEVGSESGGQWRWQAVDEFSFEWLDALSILAGRMTSRECDPAHPLCGSTLPDGQRIQICRPAATQPGTIAMCIRKPPKSPRRLDDPDLSEMFAAANRGASRRSKSDDSLLELYLAKDWMAFLAAAVRARKTIGATGKTGSGKSDLLRRVLGAVPESQRIVTIESDPEFGDVGPKNRVALFYNEEREGQRAVDVVKASLRLYPTTIAFQEVRGPESFALVRAIISGHNSFTSWHAAEGNEIAAMCIMLRQHPACHTTPDEQLVSLVRQSFDIIVSCNRDGDDFRVERVWFRAAEEEGTIR